MGLAALFGGAMAGCREREARAPDTVVFGALFPLTGELADKGKDSLEGVILAVEDVNSAGGIPSLGRQRLELRTADSRGDPDVGVRETERLIVQEGVVGIVGAYQSSVTKPATQVAERLETPFVVSVSLADIIIERGFRYTFRVQPKVDFYCRDQIRFLEELSARTGRPVRRVALLHENSDFGTSTAQAQKRALRARGFELAVVVPYVAAGVVDMRAEVARVLAARPDVILEVTYLNDSVLIRRALHEAGSTALLVDMAGGTVSPEYVQRLGSVADGTFMVSEYARTTRAGSGMNERFRRRFGHDITGDSAYAYQSVWVLADAIERARTMDRTVIRDALAATDLPAGPRMILPSDRLRFDADGQNETARLFVDQIQRGKLVTVWPSESAAAELLLP